MPFDKFDELPPKETFFDKFGDGQRPPYFPSLDHSESKSISGMRLSLDRMIKTEAESFGLTPKWYALCAAKDALGFAELNRSCQCVRA